MENKIMKNLERYPEALEHVDKGRDKYRIDIFQSHEIIASVYGKTAGEAETRAGIIVTAANSHFELLEALKEIEILVESVKGRERNEYEKRIHDLAKSAIQKATRA